MLTHTRSAAWVTAIGIWALGCAGIQTEVFCDDWRGQSTAEHNSWIDEVDSGSVESFESNPALNWSPKQRTTFRQCMSDTRGPLAQKISQACLAGASTVEEAVAPAGERIKVCADMAQTGNLDPRWAPGMEAMARAFCPDWSAWGAERRAAFIDTVEKSTTTVVDRWSPTTEQRGAFLACLQRDRASLIDRLEQACAEEIVEHYQHASSIGASWGVSCAQEAGVEPQSAAQ